MSVKDEMSDWQIFRFLKVKKIVESFVFYSNIQPACSQRVEFEDTCFVMKLALHCYEARDACLFKD